MQAIFIWFEHYIRRSRRFKSNFNFSYNSWCALLNANRYQRNLQYRYTSSEPLLGKHCLQRTFNSFHFCRRRNYLTSSILYFSTAWGHNIFSDTAISTSYNLIFYSPHKNISNLNTDNKKLHCRTSWRYISTFLGSLLATYCVYCLEWPNNLLTTLSFRFQAKTRSVIICSLISFPPMCEWYLLTLTITFFCRAFLFDYSYDSIPKFTSTP